MNSDNKRTNILRKKPKRLKSLRWFMLPEYMESYKDREQMAEEVFAHDMDAMRGSNGTSMW